MSKKKETQTGYISMSEEEFTKYMRTMAEVGRKINVEKLMHLLRTGRITRSTTNAEALEMLKRELTPPKKNHNKAKRVQRYKHPSEKEYGHTRENEIK